MSIAAALVAATVLLAASANTQVNDSPLIRSGAVVVRGINTYTTTWASEDNTHHALLLHPAPHSVWVHFSIALADEESPHLSADAAFGRRYSESNSSALQPARSLDT